MDRSPGGSDYVRTDPWPCRPIIELPGHREADHDLRRARERRQFRGARHPDRRGHVHGRRRAGERRRRHPADVPEHRHRLRGRHPADRHITTNVIIEVDEEPGTAISRSYFTALQALPDLPLQPIASGRYRDRFQGRDGQWRFLERQVSVDLTGDVRHPPAPTLNRPGRGPTLRVRGRLAQERWAAARRSSSGRASRAGAALAAASSSSGPAQASPRTAALQRHRQACRPHGPGDGRAVGPRPRPDR